MAKIGISKLVLQPLMISPIWKNPFDLALKKGERQGLNTYEVVKMFITSDGIAKTIISRAVAYQLPQQP